MSQSPTLRLDSLLTGVFYLGLGIAAGVGFMAIRPALFVDGDSARTLANLVEREELARIGIALELGAVTFQALAAVWFARLFRHIDAAAANAVALFGMVNAVAVLASAVLMRAALDIALGGGGDPGTSHLLIQLGNRFWEAGGIFFGLWLIPMGWLVIKGEYGPRLLGFILILGGVGYAANVFVALLAPNIGLWAVALPILATVGEFWMIGLLFWKSLRRVN